MLSDAAIFFNAALLCFRFYLKPWGTFARWFSGICSFSSIGQAFGLISYILFNLGWRY